MGPDWVDEFCVKCKQTKTPEGHDPCIANLPGVLYACCGHGNEDSYIKFNDGRVIRFQPIEVDLDLPTASYQGVPVFQLGGSRVFNFIKNKVEIKKYNTNVVHEK